MMAAEAGQATLAHGHSAEPDRSHSSRPKKTELKDELLRTFAEWRTCAERARTRSRRCPATYAVTNFARDMLNVADNVRQGHRERSRGALGPGPTVAFEGLIERNRADRARPPQDPGTPWGEEAVDPQGQRFDPDLHRGDVRGAEPRCGERKPSVPGVCSPATRSVTGSCGRPWWGVAKGGPSCRLLPKRTGRRHRGAHGDA